MPTIVVDVMPKAELLDPQGKAVAGALARLGYDVRYVDDDFVRWRQQARAVSAPPTPSAAPRHP